MKQQLSITEHRDSCPLEINSSFGVPKQEFPLFCNKISMYYIAISQMVFDRNVYGKFLKWNVFPNFLSHFHCDLFELMTLVSLIIIQLKYFMKNVSTLIIYIVYTVTRN